jgi:hypothetical protein
MKQRWQSIERIIGLALIGQAGKKTPYKNIVEPGYNDTGLCNTSSTVGDIL